MTPDTAIVFNLPRKRWLRCFIIYSVFTSVLWMFFTFGVRMWSGTLSTEKVLAYVAFLVSQLIFLFGEMLVIKAEDQDAGFSMDTVFGILKITWKVIIGASLEGVAGQDAMVLARKVQLCRDRALFILMCAICGCLSMVSILSTLSSHLEIFEILFCGAAAGLLYATLHLRMKRMILSFPIIQRELFFSFKLRLLDVAKRGFKIAVVSLLFSEAALFILDCSALVPYAFKREQRHFLVRQLSFLLALFFLAFCWELGHHLVEVIHTKRYKFAPPFGTSAAETSPNDMLLMALEETERSSLVHYLAALDLCMLSENNTDQWRKLTLFEESGETYQRVISECLRPLNILTVRLASRLDESSLNQNDILKQQMQSDGTYLMVCSSSQIFADFQMCTWCARSVAALTAFSKNNDRYGVAQLRGCNGAVVSTLLSCLLIVEVYLGRRSSVQSGKLASVNSINWTVPTRAVLDSDRRHILPLRKKSELYKRVYAMADVLCTSLYQIVSAFQCEMLAGSGHGGINIVERDWLGKGKPLYGTHEMHLQKLGSFLEFHA